MYQHVKTRVSRNQKHSIEYLTETSLSASLSNKIYNNHLYNGAFLHSLLIKYLLKKFLSPLLAQSCRRLKRLHPRSRKHWENSPSWKENRRTATSRPSTNSSPQPSCNSTTTPSVQTPTIYGVSLPATRTNPSSTTSASPSQESFRSTMTQS